MGDLNESSSLLLQAIFQPCKLYNYNQTISIIIISQSAFYKDIYYLL